MLSLVGQHGRTGNIANGIDAGDVGLAEAIGDDAAAIGLHAELFEPEILDVADHSNGGNHPLGGDGRFVALVILDGCRDAVRALLNFRHFGRGVDLHALFLEALARDGGDFSVFHWHHLRHNLDHGHLRPHGLVEAGELDADRA